VLFTYDGSATPPTDAGTYAIVATIDDPNYEGTTNGTFTIAPSSGSVSVLLGALTATYTGSPIEATATTTPAGHDVTFTYDGSPTAPTDAGIYEVIGTINDPNHTGSATGSLVIEKAVSSVSLENLSFTYDDSPKEVTATTLPEGLDVTVIYNGSPTPPTDAGAYAVTGTINDPNYEGSVSRALVIAKAPSEVILGNISVTYTGLEIEATATTSVGGLNVDLTYDGLVTPPTNAGSYAVIGTIDDPNYTGSATGTLVIAKVTDGVTVTLGNLSATYTGSPIDATAATTPVGLNVILTYDGSLTAPTNAGSYEVIGTIDDPNYAGSATGTLVIAKVTDGVTVTLGNLSATYTGSPIEATAATTPGGLNVILTYDGSLTAPTNAGSYAVIGTIDDPNYAGSASGTLVIDKATPTVTVTLGNLTATYTGSPIEATATTTPEGLTVILTYDGTPDAPTEPGSYAVIGMIDDPNYAGSASGTLVIVKVTDGVTVTLGNLTPSYTGSPIEATATTTPEGLTVILTYDGELTAPTEPGSYVVIGTIDDPNYAGSAIGTFVITIEPDDVKLTITPTGGDKVTLSFPGYAGYFYQIETNTDLASVWETIGSPIEGIGSTIELDTTLGDARRFYRVSITPAP
jgi:hypothetical protein